MTLRMFLVVKLSRGDGIFIIIRILNFVLSDNL